MSKKSSHPAPPSLAELRAVADEKVAAWRELDAVAQAKRAETEALYKAHPLPEHTYIHGQLARPNPTLLLHLTAQIADREAAATAAVAEREAVIALDAAELAEGDEAARLRDLPTLRGELVEAEAEIARCEAAVVAAKQRAAGRVQAALEASMVTAARRRAAGLPFAATGFAPVPGKFVASVDEALSRGLPLPGYAANVASLKAEQRRVAADLEEQRLEAEAEAKFKATEARLRDREEECERAAERTEEKEKREAADAARARRDELAAAYLARTGGPSGSSKMAQ
jgi:hypothetical protein